MSQRPSPCRSGGGGPTHTREQLSAVDVRGQVVVPVGRGEGNPGAARRHLRGRALVLQVDSKLLLLSVQLEPIPGHWELLSSIAELHLQLVRPLLGDGSDLLQPQPELTWRERESLDLNDGFLMQMCGEGFSVSGAPLTRQGAEASLVAFPRPVEVLGSIVAFLDHRPSTFCIEREGKRRQCLKTRRGWEGPRGVPGVMSQKTAKGSDPSGWMV